MNPSTKDILLAVEQVPSDKIILLPNNKNIILTAKQVKPLTKKMVEIIPTETIPQGVAALLAFDYDANLETNTNLNETGNRECENHRGYARRTLNTTRRS